MIGIILLGLLLLGVVGSAAYSMLLMVDSTQAMIRAQSERQLLDQAETVIINSLRPLGENQKLIAPIGLYDNTDISPANGIPDVDYQQLPSLYGISTKNAWGLKIVYCPISDPIGANSLPTQNIAISNESEYSAKYVTDYNNVKYAYQTDFVQHSSYSNRSVLAFLISRKPSSTATCSNVTFDADTGKYSAPGAIVKAITRDSVLTYQANQPIMVNASDYASANSIDDLSSSWASAKPLRFIVNLNDGNDHALTDDLYFINQFPGDNKEVYIKGPDSGSVKITNSSGKTIYFENMSVNIEHVNFGSNISLNFNSSVLVTNNVTFNGNISLDDSKWSLKGETTVSSISDGTIVSLNDSELRQNGQDLNLSAISASGGVITLSDSDWSFDGGVATITIKTPGSSEAIVASLGSKIIVDDGAVLNLNNSNGTLPVAGYIDPSSTVSVSGSTINSNGDKTLLFNVGGSFNVINSSINTYSNIYNAFYINGGVAKLMNSNITPVSSLITMSVNLENGGVIKLDNSVIGTSAKPTVFGVLDGGGRHVSGKNSHIYAANCWVGLIFNSVPSGASSSSAIDLNYKIFNQSNWSCN